MHGVFFVDSSNALSFHVHVHDIYMALNSCFSERLCGYGHDIRFDWMAMSRRRVSGWWVDWECESPHPTTVISSFNNIL